MRHTCSTALLLAGILAGLAPVATAGTPQPVPLRIVTLNVKEGLGNPGTSGFTNPGDFLTTNDLDGPGPNSGLNPDIVCLQECRDFTDILAFRDQFLPGYNAERISTVDGGGNFNACLIRGDIVIRDVDQLIVGGPRRVQRVSVSVPNALRVLTFYNCHFKAFTDSGSQATRTNEANNVGNNAYLDITQGVDLDDNGSRETPSDVIVMGDLNSNDNFDGTLDGIFTHFNLGVPTGLQDLPVESLSGAASGGSPLIATFPPSSRLDYICLNENLALVFDADQSGGFSQSELNSMGFVYFSGDDGGQRSNGNANATSFASDHRPVVFSILLDGDPAAGFDPKDINLDTLVNAEDLITYERKFYVTGGAPDIDGDFDADTADLALLYDCVRGGEPADIATNR